MTWVSPSKTTTTKMMNRLTESKGNTMKALRFDCARDEGSGNDGMTVFENGGEMKFECDYLDPKSEDEQIEHISVYLDRDSVKELVCYLSDWLR